MNTQAIYRQTHSQLRRLAVHYPLREICRDRQYWHGDKYSKPQPLGARMALLVLTPGAMGDDLVQFAAELLVFPSARQVDMLKASSRMRRAAYGNYRVGRLP